MILEKIKQKLGKYITEIEDSIQPAIWVEKEHLLEVMQALKDDEELNFKLLADLTAVDFEEHIEVVYHLMNLEKASIIRVKTNVGRENSELPSVTKLWKAALVQEREVYDLLGIKFTDHPNLKRILCPEDFEGHPLRKDFKLTIRGVK